MKIMKDYVGRTTTLIPHQGGILAESFNHDLTDVTADPGVDSVTIDIPRTSALSTTHSFTQVSRLESTQRHH